MTGQRRYCSLHFAQVESSREKRKKKTRVKKDGIKKLLNIYPLEHYELWPPFSNDSLNLILENNFVISQKNQFLGIEKEKTPSREQ